MKLPIVPYRPLRSLLLLLLLASCESQTQTALFSSNCNGRPLQLQLVHYKSFERQYYTHEIAYGDNVIGVIEAKQSSSLPYEPTVYGKAPWHYLDTTRQFFRPGGYTDSVKKIPVMLYIDDMTWTPLEFDQLYTCLKQHHQAMQQTITQTGDFQPYQFGGIVYGNRDNFVKRYEKNKDDYFSIYPNGQILHTASESYGMTVTLTNGLSNTVIMPGKRILINTAQISLDNLQKYRNPKTNRSLTMDFDFRVDTTFHSR